MNQLLVLKEHRREKQGQARGSGTAQRCRQHGHQVADRLSVEGEVCSPFPGRKQGQVVPASQRNHSGVIAGFQTTLVAVTLVPRAYFVPYLGLCLLGIAARIFHLGGLL